MRLLPLTAVWLEFLIPTTSSRLFFHLVCIYRAFWDSLDRGGSQRDELFSALNEMRQLECAIHAFGYPPNWKAREELNAGEASAVHFC